MSISLSGLVVISDIVIELQVKISDNRTGGDADYVSLLRSAYMKKIVSILIIIGIAIGIVGCARAEKEYPSEYMKRIQGVTKQDREAEMLKYLRNKYPDYSFNTKWFDGANNAFMSADAHMHEDILTFTVDSSVVEMSEEDKKIVFRAERCLESRDSGPIVISDNFFYYFIKDEYIEWQSKIAEDYFPDYHVSTFAFPELLPNSFTEGKTLKDLLNFGSSNEDVPNNSEEAKAGETIEGFFRFTFCVNAANLNEDEFKEKAKACYETIQKSDLQRNYYDFCLIEPGAYLQLDKSSYRLEINDKDIVSKIHFSSN